MNNLYADYLDMINYSQQKYLQFHNYILISKWRVIQQIIRMIPMMIRKQQTTSSIIKHQYCKWYGFSLWNIEVKLGYKMFWRHIDSNSLNLQQSWHISQGFHLA